MTHTVLGYQSVLLVSFAVLAAGSFATACSSSTTTVAQSNSADSGTATGGHANGGSGNTSSGGSTATNCVELGATGCTTTAHCCDTGATCINGQCLLTTTLANGTSCTGPAECTAKTCLAGTCGPPPCRNVAENCNSDFPCCTSAENDAGTGGLFCNGSGQCQALIAAGKTCSSTLPCDTGLYCNSANTCQTYGVNGATCSTTQPCGSGLTCASGTCTPCAPLTCLIIIQPIFLACQLAAVGATCASPADCCSENCGTDKLCHAACLALGGTCLVAADCCSGECLNNTCVYSSCNAAGTACYANENCCSNHCGTNALCQ